MEIKIQKLTGDEEKKLGVRQWPVWAKEPGRFDWSYDSPEECLFLEGEVVIHAAGGVGFGFIPPLPLGFHRKGLRVP